MWQAVERHRPPGLDRIVWRSPLRGPWLTSVFGVVLLACLPLVIVTGLLDYIAYGPQFHQAIPGHVGWLHLPFFDWPTHPAWLFRLTQGPHVGLGLVLVPVVLAKLWSVVPTLFAWPPARSVAHVLERASLLFLVGGILFEIVTGVLDIQYDYVFGFSFYAAHYIGAWVFRRRVRRAREPQVPHDGPRPALPVAPVGAAHVTCPHDSRAGGRQRTGRHRSASGEPEQAGGVGPGRGWCGGGRGAHRRPDDRWVHAPGRTAAAPGAFLRSGPNAFQVNRTARSAGITVTDVDSDWQLTVHGGPHVLRMGRDRLLALRLHTAELPIACVEGWSSTQSWTGVPLRDLVARSGVRDSTPPLSRHWNGPGRWRHVLLADGNVASAVIRSPC